MADMPMPNSVFDRLLKDRIIWLGSEVRDENANEICAKMLLLAAEDPEKDIYLYINSPGGSITAGMAIYDTMQFVPNDIVTVGIGMAASMGQLLLTSVSLWTTRDRRTTRPSRLRPSKPAYRAVARESQLRLRTRTQSRTQCSLLTLLASPPSR